MPEPLIDAAAAKEPQAAPAPPPQPQPTPPPQPAPIVQAVVAPTPPPPQAPAQPGVVSVDLASVRAMAEEAAKIRDELARTRQRDVDERRIAKLREMGLITGNGDFSESEILALAPKDDPHAPGADVAYEAFRSARPRLFRSREPSLEQRVASIQGLKEARFKDTRIMNYTTLANTILGGKK